jgi:hypothetical protein
MPNMTVGDISKKIGFIVTRKDIEALGITAAEHVKGYPKFSPAAFPAICRGFITKLEALEAGYVPAEEPDDDDDEL